MNQPEKPKLIRVSAVMNLTGFSRSHIFTMARNGNFPKQVKLSPNTSAWVESEVLEWIEQRIALRDKYKPMGVVA